MAFCCTSITFLCPAGILDKYDAVGTFLEAAIIPVEHLLQ